MGAFEYTALEPGGRERKGILEGDTARQVRQLLREKQLLPVTVIEVALKEASDQKKVRNFSLAGNRVSVSDLSLFTRQLATLVRAGLPSKNPCWLSRSKPRSRAFKASSSGCARA